jgi:hypothetical protein
VAGLAALLLAAPGAAPAEAADVTVNVPGGANLWLADGNPAPGDGPGSPPPSVPVPTGATSFSVVSVSGMVSCCSDAPNIPPDGGGTPTTITPVAGSIGGYQGPSNLPLLGLFLKADPPPDQPGDLDSDDTGDFGSVSPTFGQPFFIGNGRRVAGGGQTFRVPRGARRLYLGIPDSYSFNGPPQKYEDNNGAFRAVIRFASGCELKTKVAGWEFKGRCKDPDKLDEGVDGVSVTAPSGWSVQLPSVIDYALPLKDRKSLFVPVVLPNIAVRVGGMTLGAFENTLDPDGLSVGTAGLVVPNGSAVVHDLRVASGYRVSAASLDLTAYGFGIGAEGISFSPSTGLSADEAVIGLPESLGSGLIGVKNFGVTPQGAVRGTLSRGEFTVGGIAVKFDNASLAGDTLSLGKAELELPPYLGSALLRAENVRYDFADHTFSVERASGRIKLAIAGGRVRVEADVDATFARDGGYQIAGAGSVVVGASSNPFFKADARIRVASIRCPKVPPGGACANAVYLQEAALSIEADKPIPLGSTGIGVKGLSGRVHSSQSNPTIDERGEIHGVTYVFGLGARFETLLDRGFAFDGGIQGSLSTNGNFGLSVDGTTLRYVQVHGGVCVRFAADSGNAVCERHISARRLPSVVGSGVFLEARLQAGLSFPGGRAELTAGAFGRFARVGGQAYIDAEVDGSVSAEANALFFANVSARGSLEARIGRFNAPGGASTLGVKGRLSAIVRVRSVLGDSDRTVNRAVFMDQDGNYTEENVNQYTPVVPTRASVPADPMRVLAGAAASSAALRRPPRPPSGRASAVHPFRVGRGQGDTTIVVTSDRGDPSLALTAPDGLRIAVRPQAQGRPTPQLTPPRGRTLTREERASIFAVDVGVPGVAAVYLPAARPGRWSAEVTGVPAGSYRLTASGNKPVPELDVTAPRRRVARTKRRPRVLVAGTLRGAPRRSRVSLYAGSARCQRRDGDLSPRGTGTLLARNLPVRSGRWRYHWNTRRAARAQYHVYAILENGRGPLVADCAESAIVLKPPRRTRRPRSRASVGEGRTPASELQAIASARTCQEGASRLARAFASARHAPLARSAAAIPIFNVTTSATPCIAVNDAAAISLVDPSSGAAAVTVQGGKYVRYGYQGSGGAPSTLTYGPLAPGGNSVSRTNRREACGRKPFKKGAKPGPPDTKGEYVSCDEYPFASSLQGGVHGGHVSIIRGVRIAENLAQGGQLSAFLQNNATKIENADGKFRVCVKIGAGIGACG